MLRRGFAVGPVVEPGLADLQRPAGDRVRGCGVRPSGRRWRRPRLPAHRLVDPEGHRALEHITLHPRLGVLLPQPGQLRATVLAQWSAVAVPVAAGHRDPVAQGAVVDPGSRTTCAIGLPISNTSRTAPALKPSSNFRCCGPVAPPSEARSPRYEGSPDGPVPPVSRLPAPDSGRVSVLGISGSR